jgi:hypothetical protein
MQKDTGSLVPFHYFGFGYAALVATGGIIGYAKAGSVPSLAAGLFFGGLAAVSASQERVGFPSCFWDLGWHYGDAILQLWKVHACGFNCRHQFADDCQTWS